ncbi:hydroxymethylpyrimidine pyrophosphatase-like HAD family hydrolase [Deinobacterium chartae]|uniref:Hydroxymethylpyrimidine pyrophosphatase-like HAD family hydrolase n=1 Tax=Deinobacterium chartae TaxID=521158 RepID=A0A841I0K8_9DEIO|nr:haloacid dehalogenase [Deinobacterium chartae]MBB6098636.1 hydroxymethylpyrimidine pyrophosphatase-like HAD family hydrolase [Deinobacterium chartae]
MRTVAFVDLDDTLFQTRPKCPPGEELRCAALGRDGQPLSFMTARQQHFLEHLLRGALVVPVTGRDRDAFGRVQLRLEGHAVLDHGATLLDPGGRENPEWAARTRAALEAVKSDLDALLAACLDFCLEHGLGITPRVLEREGYPVYLLLRHPRRYPDTDLVALERVRRFVVARVEALYAARLRVIANGNNITVLPRAVSKERAVAFLMERLRAEHGELFTLGVGDSISDFGFMSLCDFAVTPQGSQIARAFLEADHVQR